MPKDISNSNNSSSDIINSSLQDPLISPQSLPVISSSLLTHQDLHPEHSNIINHNDHHHHHHHHQQQLIVHTSDDTHSVVSSNDDNESVGSTPNLLTSSQQLIDDSNNPSSLSSSSQLLSANPIDFSSSLSPALDSFSSSVASEQQQQQQQQYSQQSAYQPKYQLCQETQGNATSKIAQYLRTNEVVTPCLIIDLDIVERNYLELSRSLSSETRIFYAVKANPAVEILRCLAQLGSNFDTASRGEIDLCLSVGISPDRISFGNTIKKQRDVEYAFTKGVRLFAIDSEAELHKIPKGASIFCRVLMECSGAEWPLSRKFGCTPEMAVELLVKSRDMGLDPYGISFHVGSQQTDLTQWNNAVGSVAKLFRHMEQEHGIKLRMVNLGGGFPARYRTLVPDNQSYGQNVMNVMRQHFGENLPDMIVEPGRSIVGDAGLIETEVVLISTKGKGEDKRWVYLDIGKFHGLAETMDEAIKYRFQTPCDGNPTGPVVIAGPTCDSADILYEKTEYHMPLDLKVGDRVWILSTGAYTTTYSSVWFNGFAPLSHVCI